MTKKSRAEGQKGAAAIEFAIVAWPVIFMIGAICEVGIFLLMQFELQFGVDQAARLMRVNKTSGLDSTAFKNEICKNVVMISDCNKSIRIDVRSGDTFATLGTPDPVKVGPGSESYTQGMIDRPGSVIATYDWTFLFPFMNIFGNVAGNSNVRRLYGISVFRSETS